MTKLADCMVRDPFHKSVELNTKDAPEALGRALVSLGLKSTDRPLLATPITRAKNIIDAKADGTCDKCGQAVWMSPSSWRARDRWSLIVCLGCLEKAAEETLP